MVSGHKKHVVELPPPKASYTFSAFHVEGFLSPLGPESGTHALVRNSCLQCGHVGPRVYDEAPLHALYPRIYKMGIFPLRLTIFTVTAFSGTVRR